ncbi:MAG: L-threonylcarbamoyladenylate synthase [Christensenellales bacterium]|jgi:L-threonylcarbamoyladenylate synthase
MQSFKEYKTLVRRDYELAIPEAAQLLIDGELVAFPTETVYGLGANALDPVAVKKIFKAKGRPGDNPLIVHVAEIAQAEAVSKELSQDCRKLMAAFWPGALSLVVKKADCLPGEVSAGLKTVAIRMPDNDIALSLIRAAKLPIAAPSANLSGLPSPTRAEHVLADMNGRIPVIIDGGPCRYGVESTVVDVSDEAQGPVILRPGAVTKEMIEQVCGRCSVSEGVTRQLENDEEARSPGMKHRHYSPKNGRVLVLEGDEGRLADYLKGFAMTHAHRCAVLALAPLAERLSDIKGMTVCDMGDTASYAAGLFDKLRRLDDDDYDIMICQAVPEEGLGLALMNRLLRASGFQRERII